MRDFLFYGSLNEIDPSIYDLIQYEEARQNQKIIMIPSESIAPRSVREAIGSVFQNIYAEGYPNEETRWMTEQEILDYEQRLGEYRRYGDPRFYKGVEYADIAEALARRRCAELFAANGVDANDIYVNVQPLSGAPANNAVYHALLNPGDVLMGMDLFHGGHLTHGSPANRSGKLYQAVHYSVDPQTEQINYDSVQELVFEHKPKIIVVGYSSYPWTVDWQRFRKIADSVGAVLMADIAHVAGLVAGGVYPTPVGFADVITFTTHKTLCGPRGACILTFDSSMSSKIDKAVFPGEQGGPHVNIFAAMAVAFKLARTNKFKELQQQIVKNTDVFTRKLAERGFRIAYGGSNTHLMNLDVKSVQGKDGTRLNGEQAARLLDLAGIVTNRNTIPGDKSALNPTGVRMASPWVTQRGFEEAEMSQLADIVADVLNGIEPYTIISKGKSAVRTKIDFWTLENAKLRVKELLRSAASEYSVSNVGYPHFYTLDDNLNGKEWGIVRVKGENQLQFLNYILSCDLSKIKDGEQLQAAIVIPEKEKDKFRKIDVFVKKANEDVLDLIVSRGNTSLVATWLRDLSDGYVDFDSEIIRKLPGLVSVTTLAYEGKIESSSEPTIDLQKPYFIGKQYIVGGQTMSALPVYQWEEKDKPIKRTPIYEVHLKLGARMIPFAGWEMPVWYSSVMEEHIAVREAAGLFDVTHMGVYQAEGKDACAFLDSVCANDISSLKVGESLYTHFMNINADILDDLMVYRRAEDKYLIVVNAANDDKNWAWLNAVKNGEVCVDREFPWVKAYGRNVILKNLRDSNSGEEMRVDVALQGPKSQQVLFALGCDDITKKKIKKLKRTELCEAVLGGFDLIVSRTGYTGEKMAYELFVHPAKAAALFESLLEVGKPYQCKPCGLGARDSLRTEAGLPLYGHELDGPFNLGAGEAGFASYVKTYKPWFIGRNAFIQREKTRNRIVVRFKFIDKGVRLAHLGDPVLDQRGKVIGFVTSCAVDKEGMLCGQAIVDVKYSQEDTMLYIFQGESKGVMKLPQELELGDKAIIPTPAKVVSRFM